MGGLRIPARVFDDPRLIEASHIAERPIHVVLAAWLAVLGEAAGRDGEAPDKAEFIEKVGDHVDLRYGVAVFVLDAFRSVGLIRDGRIAEPERWFEPGLAAQGGLSASAEG